MSWFTKLCSLFLGFLTLSGVAVAAPQPEYAEGYVLVRFSSASDLPEAQAFLEDKFYEVIQPVVPALNLYLVKLKSGLKTKDAVTMLSRQDDILYAQPDHYVKLRETVAENTEFGSQWGLKTINAPLAWDVGTGGKDRNGNEIVIAVVDGGIDTAQKNLVPNLWVNPGEIPGNHIDDDANGYIDDVYGWNAFLNTGDTPAARHGTHVAGIAGAKAGKDLAVTGVNWNVKLMAVAAASGKTSVVAAGYGYVLAQKKLWLESKGKKGANIVVTNSSFGVDLKDCTKDEFPIWNDLYNEMGKVGILSAVATANRDINVDERGDVPTGCSSQFLIKVTNTDKEDNLNPNAAFGLKTIDLGAPGTDVLSTLPNDRTGKMSGTSMATPHVAGAVALLHSVASLDLQSLVVSDPAKASLALKALLLQTVDPIEALKGKTTTGDG